LGDKTQIAILTLSARYGFVPVFAGAALAFVILNALAVTVGVVIAKYVPEAVIRYLAAAVFIVFGLLSFRPEKVEEKEKTTKSPLLTSLLVVALMEFGDKTQLSLVALTSKYRAPVAIYLGGTAALLITSLVGALVGEGLGRVIPFKWVRIASGIVFVTFGVLIAAGIL
jgi:putative Ca2+/H+ antiporter (TMEM165/GDT1 family)